MADGPCNIYELNQAFVDAIEFMDTVILDRSKKQRRLFVDMIPRGVYPLGQGYIRKKHKFHNAVVDQAALTNWQQIQVSRPSSGSDPGYDACRYESDTVDYAFETLEYTGYETSKRSLDICLKDIKWKWQFRQQMRLIFQGLANTTLSVQENFNREMYLKFCADEGQIFVLANGAPNTVPLSTTYDPFTTDEIEIPRDINISTLNWSFMEWFYQLLDLEARASAIGSDDGQPLWGLVIHPKDFDYMIRNDADIREDFRYERPSVLIDNFGKVKMYKGYALTYDNIAPRFAIKEVGSATMILERVVPYITESTSVGDKPVVNPAYLNAEYAMGIIFLKDVFKVLVPPSGPASPGGGTQFGVVPNLNGDFAWLNIQDRCENPKREKGFYMATFENFAEPREFSDEAIAFLYLRCPQSEVTNCTECTDGSSTSAIVIVSAEANPVTENGETSSSYTRVEIVLGTCLGCEPPAEIGVDYDADGTADATAVLTQAGEKPTYQIQFATEAEWVSGSTIVAGTSTVICA